MLVEAAVWQPEAPRPSIEEALADPHIGPYLAGWPRSGDYGVIAEAGAPVGAAWYRTFSRAEHGYGFVDDDVPELSIAVVASHRRHGIGRQLLLDLVDMSAAQGYPALSLSVAEENPARRLYLTVGFVPVEKVGGSWTMVYRSSDSH